MKIAALALAFAVAASPSLAQAPATPAAPVKLWRLDCGTIQVNDLNAFSDTRAYTGRTKTLVSSCYLIRHGDRYMVWDTGYPAALVGAPLSPSGAMSSTMRVTLVDQLSQLKIRPEQIEIVGISHLHGDHTGQARAFPGATLMIGSGDWALLTTKPLRAGLDPVPLALWTDGGGKSDPVKGDRDVFGDGSVTMIDLPGHTPGHHGLLVRLTRMGPVLLTGDEYHFAENYANDGVPIFNTSRAETLASHDRFKKLAANLRARVIIQHEPADVAKLPRFPAAAD